MPAHLIAEEGPHRGLIINLFEGAEWIVGRDPEESDFVIEDTTVSRKHAHLTRSSDGILLENLSRVNPTLVNDEEIGEPYLLKEGDRVQIGNSVFLFSEEEIPEKAPKPKKTKAKKKGGYDDIFGAIDEPQELMSEETPPEKKLEETTSAPTPYDTIFEDSDEESEIPFNLLPESPLLLKVISGPNAGAEIGIEKGKSYTLGKDGGSCDIVFQDLSVSRNHARLTVNPDGILEIEDLGSKNGTAVNGVPLTEKKVITPQDMISLGTTVFFVIDREAPQETIYSPVLAAPQPAKEEIPFDAPVAAAEVAEERDWKKVPIPGKYLIGAASLAAIFLIIFLSFFSLFKPKGLEIAKKEPTSRIKEAIAPYKDVQFTYNPSSGKLFLVGHISTSADYQQMRFSIGEIAFVTSVEDTVIIDELVSKTMNDILSSNATWRSVSIQSPQAGKFVAVGYIKTNQDASLLSDYLTVNFPYLDRLENKVTVEENLNAQLQGLILAKGFGTVTFQLSNGEVVLVGNYSDKMEHEYDALLKTLNGISGVASVKNYAIATHPNLAAINVSDQFQVSGSSLHGKEGYSVVLNGKMYTLGDTVSGLKITTILANTILLEKDGIKYKIDYTR
jgi:type III secretion system YscD/HrpQ family protein